MVSLLNLYKESRRAASDFKQRKAVDDSFVANMAKVMRGGLVFRGGQEISKLKGPWSTSLSPGGTSANLNKYIANYEQLGVDIDKLRQAAKLGVDLPMPKMVVPTETATVTTPQQTSKPAPISLAQQDEVIAPPEATPKHKNSDDDNNRMMI